MPLQIIQEIFPSVAYCQQCTSINDGHNEHFRQEEKATPQWIQMYPLYLLIYKLAHIAWQECRLCGHNKKDSVHIVCDCPVLACKRYRICG
jgi:hypothetical protein